MESCNAEKLNFQIIVLIFILLVLVLEILKISIKVLKEAPYRVLKREEDFYV